MPARCVWRGVVRCGEDAADVCSGAVSVETPCYVVARLGRRRGDSQPYGHGELRTAGLMLTGQLGHRCKTIRIVGCCWKTCYTELLPVQRLLLTCDNDDSGRDAHAENVVHNGVD